ncbi:amylase-binding protein [Streptococcus oralis subsp. tigurinus]|uniref:Amylase-binding protein n=1 Tax=Streptococcus oralis subsp. tigurinus TaxID=1077464 RepID=A0A1X1G0A3_STROR|nr:amylase-binding adhesin AbpA [Streptococcus oralis]MCY7079651.1 amylase-binding adhesin AbpA [Streptococcus oralis]ORO40015.1 amylase-binding protein [Streptococcus oralis subsp. tigurinus]
MKKVLLSSVVALAVFSAAAPAFADINGGANTPGAYDSREAYENQSEFVSARTVEEYLNGHMEDIKAEAAQDPAVVAAKAELDAVEGGSHLYGEKKAAYEAAYNTAFLNVRNEYVQKFQEVQNSAKKAEGNYYILNETPEQKNARYEKEHGKAAADQAAPGQAAADKPSAKPEEGKPGVADQAKKSAEAAKKAGVDAKAGQKALPKTHAAK